MNSNNRKKRPLGITILGIVSILSALWTVQFIGEPAVLMGIHLEGIFGVIWSVLNISLTFFIGVGFLRLLPIARKLFLWFDGLAIVIIVVEVSLFLFKVKDSLFGYKQLDESMPSDMTMLFMHVATIVILTLLCVYVYRQKEAFRKTTQ